jgi:hypothetical protein
LFAGNKAVATELQGPPAQLRDALVPMVAPIVEAAIAAIRSREPGLGTSERALERNLRAGLTHAVDRWFDGSVLSGDRELHFALGRAQARSGRSLDELMGFYRLAAQTMWRRLTEVGAAAGIAPEHLYRLAETGFGCVEELSTQAAAGFSEEHSHRLDATRTRRGELVRLLLKEPPPSAEALTAAARSVGVELAPGSQLAVFAGSAAAYEPFMRSAREPIVMAPRDGAFAGVLLDSAGPMRRAELVAAAERACVQLALGPTVPAGEARESMRRAHALLALAGAGLIDGGMLLVADEHTAALLLSADAGLAGELHRHALAPLQQVRGEATRANLLLTLRACLRHPGQRKTIAHELGVHPQTVRYRLARLRELYGAALDDPDARFELELALRVEPYAPPAAARGDD